MTTAGSGHQYFPISPGINSSGTKATQVVRIVKVTGRAISRVASMALVSRSPPDWRYSWMFSPTTIASSTTIPMATRNPNIEIMLILTPTSGRNINPPINEIAIPIITQKASRISRKMARMVRTMRTASAAFSSSNDSRSS